MTRPELSSADGATLHAESVLLAEAVPPTRWDRFEELLERASEKLNPILVKEARQALRSRQFLTTFFLMLCAAWGASIVTLAILGPAAYYTTEGPTLFYIYHTILAIPLLIVAPYGAFQSLAAERQDRTYELVSITSLGPWQILTGKLGGVALQLMIYLSAIVPCLAFTYLLRGIDIISIVLAVVYLCGLSLGLSAVGLLLASLAPNRQRHIVSSVLFALVLFGAFWFEMAEMVSITMAPIAPESWVFVHLVTLTIYLNVMAVVMLSARAMLTSVCQNRSTPLRFALLVNQLSLNLLFLWGQLRWGGDSLILLVMCSTALWWTAGALMTGESPQLSPRVRRDLPQSVLGRMFFAWFAPGPGTGYMLAVGSLLSVALISCLPYEAVTTALRLWGTGSISAFPAASQTLLVGILCTSYLTIYLGIGKWLLDVLRRIREVTLADRVTVHLVLLLLGSVAPWVVQLSLSGMRQSGYSLLQLTNPFWTISKALDRVSMSSSALELASILVPAGAVVVWVLNVRGIARELSQAPEALPERVLAEEQQLAQAAHAHERTNPWDDPPGP